MYARVVVDTGATSSIDSLTYEIPDGLAGQVEIGSCVLVPLGPRQAVGYIIGFEDVPSVEKTREIIADLDSPVRLSEEMFRLAGWIAEQYICPLPRVVASMLPGVMHCRIQSKVQSLKSKVESTDSSGFLALDQQDSSCFRTPLSRNFTPAQREILARIENGGDVTVDSLGDDKSSVQRILRQLEKKGAVRRVWQLLPPSGRPRVLRGVKLVDDCNIDDELIASLPDKQAKAFKVISEVGRDISIVELTQRYGLTVSPISSLRAKGLLEDVDIIFRRDPAFTKIEQKRVTLSDEQQNAVDRITSSIDSKSYQGHLLFGVTASGKTEVYLRCIEQALKMNRTALVLLPEIALTTQVMNIFKSRLGDQVAVLHSALSAGERCDEWVRISEGEAKVVLGARSAVFAPLSDLGLVVVDEEHESSYKQDTHPRYNGKEVAIQRAKEAGAALVLGSATPSIESFYLAEQGEYDLITMASRIENRPMPTVYIADLRREYARGKATIFSEQLEQGIRDRLERGEQVILLQNRRAYSTFLICRDCGYVMRCPNCAVSLKYHSAAKKLSCHHCGYERMAPDVCPKCESERIRKFGIGTERVEEETKNTFPEAHVLRMDRDTTTRKGAHASILGAFRRGEADILVGTQMIAKGLDFPNVTLVGVISADTSLNLPDFRASERTFQLISQVAGRSGRGKTPGEVVIQTLDPEQYAIERAVEHDYIGFYKQELEMRGELNYPPFASLVNIISRDEDEHTAENVLAEFSSRIKQLPMSMRKGIEILGPNPAVLSKLRGEYRWHLVMRASDRERMLDLLRDALDKNQSLRKRLTVDVDPISML